jgi:ABC-2 type transport system permease protein
MRKSISERVSKGEYQLGIVIPERATQGIRKFVKRFVNNSFNPLSSASSGDGQKATIVIYTDPTAISSFKSSILNALENFTSKIELKIISESFSDEIAKRIPGKKSESFDADVLIHFEEKIAGNDKSFIMPNSVQHNVPAWTIFAIFFVVIPLATNIIRERNDGSYYRILTMPVPYLTILFGKIVIYLLISMVLVILLFSLGIFMLPLLGLPQLEIGNHWMAIAAVSLSTALAATGYGILIGTVAGTHYQASSFGSISILILAAIGGIWVPVYVMPDVMKTISVFSPLNWGLNGYYDIFMRGFDFWAVIPNCLKLIAFFLVMMLLAYSYKTLFRKY